MGIATMSTYDQMNLCRQVDVTSFKAVVTGLRYAFVSEVPTDGGRVLLVRAGDDRGPLVGFRDDYLGNSAFYLR